MDESSGGPGNSLNPGNQSAPQNPYNLGCGIQPLEYRHAFALGHFPQLRIPGGQRASIPEPQRTCRSAIGGWTINAVSVYETGFPLQIYQTNLNSAYGYGAQRPNATGVSPGTSGSVESRLYDYINPAAFSLAPAATFGNVGRTRLAAGPGQKNWDMSLFKTYAIKERFRAQFRFEALNAFNSPLFTSPNTNFSSGSFGKISSQPNFARQLQLALRFSF